MTAAAPRGFTFDRNDGRAVLPGNLHTNRQLAQWLDFSQPGQVRVFTGKVELGQGILTALSIIAADELDVGLDQVHIVSASTMEGPIEQVYQQQHFSPGFRIGHSPRLCRSAFSGPSASGPSPWFARRRLAR